MISKFSTKLDSRNCNATACLRCLERGNILKSKGAEEAALLDALLESRRVSSSRDAHRAVNKRQSDFVAGN